MVSMHCFGQEYPSDLLLVRKSCFHKRLSEGMVEFLFWEEHIKPRPTFVPEGLILQ